MKGTKDGKLFGTYNDESSWKEIFEIPNRKFYAFVGLANMGKIIISFWKIYFKIIIISIFLYLATKTLLKHSKKNNYFIKEILYTANNIPWCNFIKDIS